MKRERVAADRKKATGSKRPAEAADKTAADKRRQDILQQNEWLRVPGPWYNSVAVFVGEVKSTTCKAAAMQAEPVWLGTIQPLLGK